MTTTYLGSLITKDPWVDSRAFSSLSVANESSQTLGKEIWITQQIDVTENLTINRSVRVISGGSFNVSGGITLTLNGTFSAPDSQVFSGGGTIIFGSSAVPFVVPEWWGAKGDYNTSTESGTDDATALLAAIATGKAVRLLEKKYLIGSSLTGFRGGQYFYGVGTGDITDTTRGSRIVYKGTSCALDVKGSDANNPVHKVFFRDFILDGRGVGYYGLQVGRADASPKAVTGNFENIYAINFTQAGIRLIAAQEVLFSRVECAFNAGKGWLIDQVTGATNTACTFISCRSYSNSKEGLHIKDASQAMHFIGFISEYNGYEGVKIDGATQNWFNLDLQHLYVEANNQDPARGSGYYAVYIDMGSYYISRFHLQDAIIFDNGSNKDLYLNSTGGTYKIENNTFDTGILSGVIAGSPVIIGSFDPTTFTSIASTVKGYTVYPGSNGKVNLKMLNAESTADAYLNILGSVNKTGVMLNGHRLSIGSAYPSVGTFDVGDIVLNGTGVVGEPLGWVNTVAGSPGTFSTFGQLGRRVNSGDPTGVVTPYFSGEELLDTVNSVWYKSTTTSATSWKALNA